MVPSAKREAIDSAVAEYKASEISSGYLAVRPLTE
jgi:hypothetical protein